MEADTGFRVRKHLQALAVRVAPEAVAEAVELLLEQAETTAIGEPVVVVGRAAAAAAAAVAVPVVMEVDLLMEFLYMRTERMEIL